MPPDGCHVHMQLHRLISCLGYTLHVQGAIAIHKRHLHKGYSLLHGKFKISIDLRMLPAPKLFSAVESTFLRIRVPCWLNANVRIWQERCRLAILFLTLPRSRKHIPAAVITTVDLTKPDGKRQQTSVEYHMTLRQSIHHRSLVH